MRWIVFLLVSIECFGLTFHQSIDTLNTIRKIILNQEKGVYLRFGDGDVYLANGMDDSLQTNNLFLRFEMEQAFSLNGPNVLKCLPLHCREMGGYEEGMNEPNHQRPYEWCKEILSFSKPIWNGDIEDVYSMTALAHSAVSNPDFCIDFLKFLKSQKVALLIGNSNIPKHVRDILFGPDCLFIPTPPQNSYSEIDRIERECIEWVKKKKGYKVIVTSMGCSGRALQYRLWTQLDDVFLFDFGSLMDAICGWMSRQWMDVNLSHFEDHKFLKLLNDNL